LIQGNFVNRFNLDLASSGNVAALPWLHFAPFPQADGLRFPTLANGV
jgi:hypothetical protein